MLKYSWFHRCEEFLADFGHVILNPGMSYVFHAHSSYKNNNFLLVPRLLSDVE